MVQYGLHAQVQTGRSLLNSPRLSMADAAVLAQSLLPEQPDDDMQQVSSVLLQAWRQITSVLTTQRQAELHHLSAPSAAGMLSALESSKPICLRCSSGVCIQPINGLCLLYSAGTSVNACCCRVLRSKVGSLLQRQQPASRCVRVKHISA